ncbi:MAG: ABC transporter permease [Chloroflexi bacterium]|nr:ABC transporter permease [Chloroflexota bacterium]MDA1239790.1 ABC transporter permease [Chloroflexota bacterium]MQC47657.1 ABC transporter permease [Chloroflexota bacterium]
MTTATPAPAPAEVRGTPVLEGESQWQIVWRRLRRKKLAMASLALIIVIYGAGIAAPLLAPYSYREINLDRSLEGPSAQHLLGTDRLGRDMLSRTMYSARTTLIVTTAVVLSGSLLIGNVLGLLAGYRGGWLDTLVMRVGEIFSGLPALIMLILINVSLGPRVTDAMRWIEDHTFITGLVASGFASYMLVFSTLSLFFWVGTARIIRAQVLALRETDFVLAAEAMGASPWRVITRHLLPNVSFLIILSISSTLGGIAGSEIFLTWFGVGVQPPAASFGAMLFEGSGARTFQAHPHLLLIPGTVVTMLLFAFNLLGDALNDAVRGR